MPRKQETRQGLEEPQKGKWPGFAWAVLSLLASAPVLLALWAGATAGQITLLALAQAGAIALITVNGPESWRYRSTLYRRLKRSQTRADIDGLIGDQPAPERPCNGPHAECAAMVLRLDDADRLMRIHGQRHYDALIDELSRRLGEALRVQDGFCLLPPDGFGVALRSQGKLDAAVVTAIAERLQRHLGRGFVHDGLKSWHSLSIGICLSAQTAQRQGLGMIDAAARAANRARQHAPGTILAFTPLDMPTLITGDRQQALMKALETGAICAHFQPQIAADTGRVSGLEALARWESREGGLISPAAFLPEIQQAGLAPRLGQRVLADALDMLAALDRGGLTVPNVAINLSQQELHNPRLADEIAWALDSRDMAPDRLVLEILENVVADSDEDIAVRTVARLAGMGCGIDLDDFGTGHASIANIRHFAVGRLKIDRSFVRNLHVDMTQRKMVSAILSMARELELGTVAEGVECTEEMTLLARLGCGHLQGFAIARPMPADSVLEWLRDHARRLGGQANGHSRQSAEAGSADMPATTSRKPPQGADPRGGGERAAKLHP